MSTACRARSALLAGVLWASPLVLFAQPVVEPPLALKDLQGEVLDTPALAQGTYIVVFWTSWSPRSRDIVRRVAALAGRWQDKAHVVTVDFEEDRKAVETFLGARVMAVPVYLDVDGVLAKKFGVATLPGLLVLRDGSPLYRGPFPDDPERVVASVLK